MSQGGTNSPEPVTTTYDTYGRVTDLLEGDGTTKDHVVYSDGFGYHVTSIRDQGNLNLTTDTSYDSLGRPKVVVDANRHVTSYDYVQTSTSLKTVMTPPAIDEGTAPGSTAAPGTIVTTDLAAGTITASTYSKDQSYTVSKTVQKLDYAGRVVETDRYFDVPGGGFHTSTASYDLVGRPDRSVDAVKTVTRTVYDGLDRPTEVWLGTDDSGWSSDGSAHGNLTRITTNQYDGGQVGDGLLTQSVQTVGAGAGPHDRELL